MVDFDPKLIAEQTEYLDEITKNFNESIEGSFNWLSKTYGHDMLQSMEDFGRTLANGVKDARNALETYKSKFEDIQKYTKFEVAFDEQGTAKSSIDRLALDFSKFDAFVKHTPVFDHFATASQASISTVLDSVNELKAGFSNLGLDVAKEIPGFGLFENIAGNAAQAEKLENTYTGLLAAQGRLNDAFEGGGTVVKDLSALTGAYTNMIGDVAERTELGVQPTLQFAQALGTVPGAMNEYNAGAAGSVEKTNGLLTAMQLMTGSGRSQTDVINALTTAYEKLGQSQGRVADNAQKGAQFFAMMSMTANDLDLRFEDVQKILTDVANRFEFVGNETDGAARMLARYTDALRETGLSAGASVSVVNQMTESIGKLSMGTKAFISARSGGPGGLQGAFRVEEMLREGKIDQVSKMIEQTLKQQFGGRIYTLQQASQSPEAKAQFMKQRAMLTSGAFGNLTGGDQDKATRLLEAFGKGSLEGAKAVKDGQTALKTVAERGASLQDGQFNEFKRMNATLDRAAIAAEITAAVQMRSAFGGGAGLRTAARAAGASAGLAQEREANMRKGGPSATDWMKENILAIRNFAEQMGEGAVGVAKGTGNLIGGAVKTGADVVGALANMPGGEAPQANTPATATPHRANVFQQTMHHAQDRTATAQHTADAVHAAAAAHQVQMKAGKEMPTQKVELTITAPPGFDVKTKRTNANVIIKHINQASRVPNPSDPG